MENNEMDQECAQAVIQTVDIQTESELESDSLETPTENQEGAQAAMETAETQTESELESDSLEAPPENQEGAQAAIETVETQTESELESDSLETPPTENPADDKRRFAYDVVKAVMHCSKGITISDSAYPPHQNFLFTDVHNDDVIDFLQLNENFLKKLVGESTKERDDWNYNDENYLLCKRKILEEYKPEFYMEKEFVRLCAGIAFIAIGSQSIGPNPSVITGAVHELHSWMNEVLMPGGTLQDSTWA